MEYVSLTENLKFSCIIAGCMRTLDAGMDGEKLRSFVHGCMELGIDTLEMRFFAKILLFVTK